MVLSDTCFEIFSLTRIFVISDNIISENSFSMWLWKVKLYFTYVESFLFSLTAISHSRATYVNKTSFWLPVLCTPVWEMLVFNVFLCIGIIYRITPFPSSVFSFSYVFSMSCHNNCSFLFMRFWIIVYLKLTVTFIGNFWPRIWP